MINIKSDFKILLDIVNVQGEVIDPLSIDFEFTYTSGKNTENQYIISNLKGVLTNCKNVNNKLLLIFENHGFTSYIVKEQRHFLIPDIDFKDKINDVYLNSYLDFSKYNCLDDNLLTEQQVILAPYIKGEDAYVSAISGGYSGDVNSFYNNLGSFADNEDTRVIAEHERERNEFKRINNEVIRTDSEKIRVSNENKRIENTQLLKEEVTESLQAINTAINSVGNSVQYARESGNYAKEQGDLVSTSINNIKTTDDSIKNNESVRVTSENNRQIKESERLTSELLRISNETERINKETLRDNNEVARVLNESSRVESESNREVRVSEVINNANTAINNATDASNYANIKGDYANTQGNYAKEQGDYAKNILENLPPPSGGGSDILESEVVNAASVFDNTFINVNNEVKQISLLNLKTFINNPVTLLQLAMYTDFETSPSTILPQGGVMGLIDLILSKGGNYLMKSDGTATKLHPNNSNLFLDGTPATLDGSLGQEMTLLPEYYYKVETLPVGFRFWISTVDIGGNYQPPQWIGTHLSYDTSSSNTLSVSNARIAVTNLTTSTVRAGIQLNGVDWDFSNYDRRKQLALLFYVKYGTSLAKGEILGTGLVVNTSTTTGNSNILGDGTGFIDVGGNIYNSLFGVRDPFLSDSYEIIGGMKYNDYKKYIETSDNFDMKKNLRNINYSASGGYVKNLAWYGKDFVPQTGASSTTYYGDYCKYKTVSGYHGVKIDGLVGFDTTTQLYSTEPFIPRLAYYGPHNIIPNEQFLTL